MSLYAHLNSPKPSWWCYACLLGLGVGLWSGCGPAKPTTGPAQPAPAKTAAKPTKTDTNAPPAKAEIPKSVFVDDLKEGVDPFFPKSTRRQPKTAATPRQATAQQQPTDPFTEVVLNGILGSSRRRIATINNRPFEAGESGEITLPTSGRRVQIKCLKITENSVELAIEGQPEHRKTISLRKDI